MRAFAPPRSATIAAVVAAILAVAGGAYAQPRVESVALAGTFRTNAVVWARDAGYSARVGESILWLFGDTFTRDGMRCATAAWSSPERPLLLTEEIDRRQAPYQLYRFDAEESAFNRRHANPPACCYDRTSCAGGAPYCNCPAGTDCAMRIALWPGSVVATGERSAVGLYEKVVAGVAPYDFHHIGTGVARIKAKQTVATRAGDHGGTTRLVFSHPEPNFLHGLAVGEGAQRYLYAYAAANRELCGVDVLLTRVPIEQAAERAAYRFWNGAEWVEPLDAASPILAKIPGGLGAVAWNDSLRAYVSAFSDLCTGGKLHVRSAPRPEGPWSEATVVDLAPIGATAESYAGLLHPELGRGAEMWFTFYRPEKQGGELRVGKIRFAF